MGMHTTADLKLTWCKKTKDILSQLFVKPIVRKLGIGIDIALSDTDTVQMSRVFGSESLRFYNCNTRHNDFLHDCLRLCTDFLDKGYPIHLLLDGLLKIWRKDSHAFKKYGNTLKDLHRDLLRHLPARFELANHPSVAYHDTSTMHIVRILPTGTSANIPHTNPFIAASKPPPPQHESGFYHWYDHFRKRRKLARLGQRAHNELSAAHLTTRYAAIRQRQLATGLPPQHHLKKRNRSGPSKFHHAAVKKFKK